MSECVLSLGKILVGEDVKFQDFSKNFSLFQPLFEKNSLKTILILNFLKTFALKMYVRISEF